MKKFFRYIENLWTGNDKKPSLRSTAAIVLLIDFVINVHNSVTGFLKLIYRNAEISPEKLSALSGNLAQMAMILGIEAALIAAILGLKTYQNNISLKTNTSQSEEGA
jgi:hypothetical protein